MSGKKNIFISYRRQDTAAEAGRLADSLKQRISDDQIFMDIDTIEPGVDFVEMINKAVSSCDLLLAIIGPDWLTIQHANGQRRLHDPDDFIRLEIGAALQRNIRVIPVLVSGAAMPPAEALPAELTALARRQAFEIRNNRWADDVEKLMPVVEKILGKPSRTLINPWLSRFTGSSSIYRTILVSIVFGLFGSILSKLMAIPEMAWYYIALAFFISPVVYLLVSFLLKGRWNKALKNNTKLIGLVLFSGLLVTVYLHIRYFIEGTFSYKDFNGKVSYFIKGDEYTQTAEKFKQAYPYIESDADLVREGFGLPEAKDLVWTAASIQKNKLKLVSSFTFLIICFSGIISVIVEVLLGHYGKSI